MTENNAAQPVLTDDEIKAIRDSLGGGFLGPIPFARAIESALLSKLRAEGVQAGDEWESFSDWAWKKDGLAIGRMDGQAAAWEAWQERARRAALASAPVAGEANTALNEWLDKTDFIQKRIACGELPVKYLGWHRADVMRDLIENAAPQGSEAVCSCPTGDGSLRHPCAVHPPRPADKDGGDCAKGAVQVCPECDIAGCKHIRAALYSTQPTGDKVGDK